MSSTTSTTNLFRRLSWQASIPLEIRLADGEPGAGSGADRYYMHVPRYTYLPLLIPEIRENLVELCLDDEQLESTKEAEWWFEEEARGDRQDSFAATGPCKWHYPIDLLHLQSLISRPLMPSSHSSSSSDADNTPLRLVLHLSNPPTDRLFLPNNPDTCKQRFMNQLKEADLARWRNTSRVTALRKVELDAAWEGIVNDDYDAYSRVFARLAPPPIPAPQTTPGGDESGQTAVKGPESSYAVRALPVLIYLPDGVPVIQEVVPPAGADGVPTTLLALLQKHLPLLFPITSSATAKQEEAVYPLAVPLILGVQVPPETELAWLAGCMCGADGWVRIGIRLRGDAPEKL